MDFCDQCGILPDGALIDTYAGEIDRSMDREFKVCPICGGDNIKTLPEDDPREER